MKITIGTSIFTATLVDNQTTSAFKTLLPITIQMSELNGNEKFFYLKKNLPTNATTGGQIQSGDLMLYGDNCLVLFYENFNTSYSYTHLGKIENVSGLTAALGSGNVTVKFELE
ncbi:MAG TPA: cyclophilin-like fold protein [Saprospiraceae bacterium]|nr:cyclophilin-like fold protein [Saprospiraceae bacterium]